MQDDPENGRGGAGVPQRPGAGRYRSSGRKPVTDLAEGDWQVLRDGAATGPAVRVTGDEGALWFEGRPGSYALQPASAAK